MTHPKWYVLDDTDWLLMSGWADKVHAEQEAERLMKETGHTMMVVKADLRFPKDTE